MMPRENRNIITGGLILITLGVLIFVSKTTSYSFGETWPILLIVIGIATLINSIKAPEGWFIATAGFVFLIIEFYHYDLYRFSKYILPAVLIILGVFVLLKRRKRSSK